MGPISPREFFDTHLRPNYEEWLQHPLDQRRARNAVLSANDMAVFVLHYWQEVDRSQVYDCEATHERSYRKKLVEECPDFTWVRDVAEAHKHVVLTRDLETRVVTRHNQTAVRGTPWRSPWGSPWRQLVVIGNDGTSRPLAEIMGNVMVMWERLLQRWNL